MGRSSELYQQELEREEYAREASLDLLNALEALDGSLTETWSGPTDADALLDLGLLVCGCWAAARVALRRARGQ